MSGVQPPDHATALELERLRGELGKGVAEIQGSLKVLVLRSEQSDQQHGEHRAVLAKHAERLDELEAQQAATAGVSDRLRTVERKVWTIAGGVTALVTASEIAALLLHH